MRVVPISIRAANAVVDRIHRHHEPVHGAKFAIAIADATDAIRGVVIAGRPPGRNSDDGFTLEVTRLATDGVRNGCSMLYRAAWRAGREMGYKRLVTYTLPEEGGASLRGAGFTLIGERGGGSWSRKSRPRIDKHPLQPKLAWELR